MEQFLYPKIFKRKSFHRFIDTGHLSDGALSQIEETFRTFQPLIPEIKVEMKIVPAEKTICSRGQESCILLYSEKKDGYLSNIGYIGAQLDLYLASRDIGALWFGIGRPLVENPEGLDFVIMIAIAQMPGGKFRRDLFKSKRKPLDEIWSGDPMDIADIVRFAPSACNTQPWIVECGNGQMKVYRYKKPGKRGIMPADRVTDYNRIDIGIFLLYLEACMDHEKISFTRTLYPDTGDEEKTLVAVYQTR